MTEAHAIPRDYIPRDYMIPEGCPVCAADLPVRISATGPSGVCKHCGWLGRPVITVTHRGLRVTFEAWNTNDLYRKAAEDCRAGAGDALLL